MSKITEFKKSPKTIADRLKYVMHLTHTTQAELAARIGVKQQTVQSITSGRIKKSRFLHDIAGALAIKPEWLISGIGEMEHKQPVVANPKIPKSIILAPIISWEAAMQWHNLKKIYNPADYQNIPVSSEKYSKSAFVLPMLGESMQPIFLDGSLIIF